MAVVANIVGISFESIAETRITELTTAMNTIIGAEIITLGPIIKALFLMFITRQGFLLLTGNLMFERFMNSIVRALIISFLLVHAPQYIPRIEVPVFTTIPQTLSAMVLSAEGVSTTMTVGLATQFDQVAQAADAVTAQIVAHNTGWSVSGLVNSVTAYLADGGIQLLLVIICAIWLLGQTLLAIILCFGPCVLVFELFDRTRGWVDQWIGKIVGMTCFGFGTAILLGIEMQGLQNLFQAANANLPASSAEAVGMMFHVACDVLLDAFTMVALPLICSIGSGVAASLAAPSGLALARAATLGRATGRSVTAAVTGGPRSANNIART